jgi:hypothetical protein
VTGDTPAIASQMATTELLPLLGPKRLNVEVPLLITRFQSTMSDAEIWPSVESVVTDPPYSATARS